MQALTHFRQKLRWLLLLPCLLLLSGCLQYDLTLRFDHQLHGHIEQVITLSDRAAAVSHGTLAPWVNALEARVRRLGGMVAETGYHQRTLTVPFTTGEDLVTQFNGLFADQPMVPDPAVIATPRGEVAPTLTIPDLGHIPFRLTVDQRSWVFASRTHLICDIDLQQLPANPVFPTEGGNTSPWSTLGFRLQTPWGIGQVLPESASPDLILGNGAQWQLQPGSAYHIDVRVWVPSLVSIGAVIIAILVVLGYFFRYRVFRRAKTAPWR